MTDADGNALDVVAAGDRWIPEREYAAIRRRVPIVCVDLLPLSSHQNPLVGLIRREVPVAGEGWCLVGGAVLRDERLVEAVLRHARATLGESFLIDTSTLRRLDIFEYFTRPGIGELVDPRKHAVSVTYVARCAGTPEPQGESLDFRWFPLEELATIPYGFGQGRVVARLLEMLGYTQGQFRSSGGLG